MVYRNPAVSKNSLFWNFRIDRDIESVSVVRTGSISACLTSPSKLFHPTQNATATHTWASSNRHQEYY